MSESEIFPAGTLLCQRFRITGRLSQGGIGVVYLAQDIRHNQTVVVKTLFDKMLQNEWVTDKFQQEKEALAKINHHSIVKIIDSGESDQGRPFFVMEYVKGKPLSAHIDHQGMELKRAARIIVQLAEALHAAHRENIFHRDLKPGNVLLQQTELEDERIKLIDFGIAKVENSQVAPPTATLSQGVAGTLFYASPEQLQSQKVSARSDVYSLGVVSYELFTGALPFQRVQSGANDSDREKVINILRARAAGVRVLPRSLRSELPENAERAILRALSFEPSERQSSALEFGREIADAVLSSKIESPVEIFDEPPPATETVVTQAVRKKGVRGKLLILTLSAALLGLIGFSTRSFWLPFLNAQNAVSLNSVQDDQNSNQNKASDKPKKTVRSLGYLLDVQQTGSGKQFSTADGGAVQNGWRYRLEVESGQKGFFYLVKNEQLLFPRPNFNAGSAELNTVKLNSGWQIVDRESDVLWLVWSEKAVAELEKAAPTTDLSTSALDFLATNRSTAAERQVKNSRANISTENEILVYKLEIGSIAKK